jgi:hypothetical protein
MKNPMSKKSHSTVPLSITPFTLHTVIIGQTEGERGKKEYFSFLRGWSFTAQ